MEFVVLKNFELLLPIISISIAFMWGKLFLLLVLLPYIISIVTSIVRSFYVRIRVLFSQ